MQKRHSAFMSQIFGTNSQKTARQLQLWVPLKQVYALLLLINTRKHTLCLSALNLLAFMFFLMKCSFFEHLFQTFAFSISFLHVAKKLIVCVKRFELPCC